MGRVVALVMIVMWLMTAFLAEGLSCGQVVHTLLPCRDYLKSGGNVVPQKCCDGARSLNNMARTTPDRQQACRCMKTAAKAYKAQQKYAAAVPGKCGVKLGYAVNFNIDCNKVR
ncbi:Non-specific lipid-transfer protein 3 [Striga hermonthica]|uniref:Non-specific lipid-transfer protein n=1 Tax=Striga hermonthica TaxID=68872 RepID=A0A9N7RJP3_STRHE|nr:Non-specific lipid-transfer protein 3 [Striga hermonthica]